MTLNIIESVESVKSHEATPAHVSAKPVESLRGVVSVPGDKSISHRALMLSTLAVGKSVINNLSGGEDVLWTLRAMQGLGATIINLGNNTVQVHGVGVGGLNEPEDVVYMGNSGTGARLLMGLLATHDFHSVIAGDSSLSSRPMQRVIDPLKEFGAEFYPRSGGRLPVAMRGSSEPIPGFHELKVASAQVKSAILLASLNCPGVNTVIEPQKTRAHTETMLKLFGAKVESQELDSGKIQISVHGHPELTPQSIDVPGDPSAAAFLIVAALVTRDSEVTVRGVMIDQYRAAFIGVLKQMGADITIGPVTTRSGEPTADVTARYSRLKGIEISATQAPSLIDEYPILSIAAAHAEGVTLMKGLGELRLKESDRIEAITSGLQVNGIDVSSGDDWISITGCAPHLPRGGGYVITHFDHRIAMSFLILGSSAQSAVTIDNASAAATSFVGFCPLMRQLGAEYDASESGE